MESFVLKNATNRQDTMMDDFLTPASSARSNARSTRPNLVQELGTSNSEIKATLRSPEGALEVLHHEPDYQSLISTLRYLSRGQSQGAADFDIRKPSPLSAQLIQVLVAEIVPNYWTLLKEDTDENKTSDLALLLSCLRSAGGINAILTRLRAHIQDARSQDSQKGERRHLSINIGILLDLLRHVLEGKSRVLDIWKAATAGLDNHGRVKPLIQELLSIFGSGKIMSLAAEAEGFLDPSSKQTLGSFWIADSVKYTTWLSDNVVEAQSATSTTEQSKFFSSLFGKALHLGHPGRDTNVGVRLYANFEQILRYERCCQACF
jgi:telomere length regulation protein